MKLAISTNDPHLVYEDENEILKGVSYKGEPFSGLLKCENEQITYVNGNAHGKNTIFFENDTIQTETLFDNGEEIESISYYLSGQKLSHQTEEYIKIWNENRQLILEEDFISQICHSYFPNGNLKSVSDNKNEIWRNKYFAKSGEILITQLADTQDADGKITKVVEYQDQTLINNYFDLLSDDYPDNDYLKNSSYQLVENYRIYLIWMWFWKVFEKNQQQYFEIINKLLRHHNLAVLEQIAIIIALNKFEPYIEKENAENRVCYALITENRIYQDKNNPNRTYQKVTL